ncbi:hypothetical protein [Lysobacter silvisoli]|uniref:Uncharacterized protein n=1 Tax=Lysobacter silvisoli TaxID=2293254 RepID=A0A371K285_9GAMM|nr:hypothetical protein [Lysobacter silvisoli]RDZ28039.1 hypothetical protein DX914_02510 [Lysobacter silvisoli]
MKFYALLILPLGTDVYDGSAVEAAAARLMQPFEMWRDDGPPGEWDYYWCCTREWLVEHGEDLAEWPAALADAGHLVVPVDALCEGDATFAVVTPEPGWFNSRATYTDDDAAWGGRAVEIFRGFPGHYAVLAYCHG